MLHLLPFIYSVAPQARSLVASSYSALVTYKNP